MGFGNKIASLFGYYKPNVWESTMPRPDFFSFTGSCNSQPFSINLNSLSGLSEAYIKCSPVSTVIGRLSSAMANGKWWVVDKNDNDKSNENRRIIDIIRNPNPLQSWTELIIQADTYRYVYGEVFFYFSIPVGLIFTPQDAVSVYAINPEYVEIKTKGKLLEQSDVSGIIEKYIINTGSDIKEVSPDNMLHIRDNYQNLYIHANDIRGKSRLSSLEFEIRNIIQAQEAIYSLNSDRGAMGLITNKTKDTSGSIPLTENEKKQLREAYQRTYGIGVNKDKVMISDADVQFQQMTFNVKDLMLFEGIKSNIEQITDVFGYQFELLANSKGATFSNKSEAEKIMYQDTIIPFSKIYAEKFTKMFQLPDDQEIIIDFSDVECMKEGEKERAESLRAKNQANHISFTDGVITKNEWRQSIEMDEIKGGDVYYGEEQGG